MVLWVWRRIFVDGLIYKAFLVNAKSPCTVHVFLCVTIRVPEDLSRFWFCAKIDRNLIPNLAKSLSKFHPNSIQHRSKINQDLIQNWSKICPKSIQNWSKIGLGPSWGPSSKSSSGNLTLWGLLATKLARLGAQDGASDGQVGGSWGSTWCQK